MAKVDKAKAQKMVLDGYTHQEIAEEFGVSRQYIAQLCPKRGVRSHRLINYDALAYPGLAKWMRRNRMSIIALAERAGMSQAQLSTILHGKHEPRKSTIDTILKATGLSYEEAFGVGSDG